MLHRLSWTLCGSGACLAVVLSATGYLSQIGAEHRPTSGRAPLREERSRHQRAVARQAPSLAHPGGSFREHTARIATDEEALLLNINLLEKGLAELRRHADYTLTFSRQERIDGELRTAETIQMKLREEPFSVHMKWNGTGREALYIQGRNDGKLLVRPGGWRRIFRRVKLDPSGSVAMAESRYAITESGLQLSAGRLLRQRQRDLELKRQVSSRMLGHKKISDRDCLQFVIEYRDPTVGPGYRKTINYLDSETGIPIAVKYYGWPDENAENGEPDGQTSEQETLLGNYVYSHIAFDKGLSDADFQLTHR